MSKETIHAWVTKYALTAGIEMVDARICGDGCMIAYGDIGYGPQFAHGKEWHLTPEAALARAEEMRKAKIASMTKRVAKLVALKFEVPHTIKEAQ